MKINANAFGAAGADAAQKVAVEADQAPPKSFKTNATVHAAVLNTNAADNLDGGQAVSDANLAATVATPIQQPIFTKAARLHTDSQSQENQPVENKEAKPSSDRNNDRLKWIWRRKASPSSKPKVSEAIEPNNSRPLLIVAGVFVIGAILGPWLAQKAAPEQSKPAGPNPAVQVVADTLNGGTFAAAPVAPNAGLVANPQSPTEVNPAGNPQSAVQIPQAGEERYTAMLERMKKGDGSPVDPVTVVPKIDPNAQRPQSPATDSSKPIDPYPKVAIPLEIEKPGNAGKVTSEPIQLERSIAPSGRYVVLRIERNPDGVLAALLMPLGGRQAIDSTWVFVGDATSDGMVIENINTTSVVMRTSNGRSIQIALN